MARALRQEDVFVAIANPIRREMLELLKSGPKSASELAEPFGVSLPAISQQLNVLKEVGLISETREGRQRIYQLHAEKLREVYDWVRAFPVNSAPRPDPFKDFLRARGVGTS